MCYLNILGAINEIEIELSALLCPYENFKRATDLLAIEATISSPDRMEFIVRPKYLITSDGLIVCSSRLINTEIFCKMTFSFRR